MQPRASPAVSARGPVAFCCRLLVRRTTRVRLPIESEISPFEAQPGAGGCRPADGIVAAGESSLSGVIDSSGCREMTPADPKPRISIDIAFFFFGRHYIGSNCF